MKKVLGLLFCFLLVLIFSSKAVFAADRIVQLNVPGCSS